MKLSRAAFFLMVVVLLPFCRSFAPSKTLRSCDLPEILFSYLDMDRYNSSYPYVDPEATVRPVVDLMRDRVAVTNTHYDLYLYWRKVCYAKDHVEEIAAWKNLAQELNHRMHTDESVFRISKILYGDRMGKWLMRPEEFMIEVEPYRADCTNRLLAIFAEQCGHTGMYGSRYIDTFTAMCVLGVEENDFRDAVIETCKDYFDLPAEPL